MFLLGILIGAFGIIAVAIIFANRRDDKDITNDYQMGYKDGHEEGYAEGLNDGKYRKDL